MAKIPGLNITAPVVPSQDTDTYPSHRAIYGYGGWREVSTVADRDAIPKLRREAGMAVYVTSEKKLYILNSDLVTWSLFSAGGVVVMPTPSETELGNIVQYIGETTQDYTQGYFYKCISDGAEPATYSWEQIDVQPATDLVWGNIEGDITDQEDLNTELTSLQDQIDSLSGRGRYLTLWNCSTGLAETNPPESPYTYKAGDYFIVGTVAASGGTNYRPDGTSYTTGVASTVVETDEVSIDDTYIYDGSTWHLQYNSQKTVTFTNIDGDPYDNTNLANALNAKVDDVQIKGAGDSDYHSVVTDKVAKIDLVSQGVDYTFDAVPNVTSVKDALDDLMNRQYYVEPSFSTFTTNKSGSYERQTSAISDITFSWTLNKTPATGDVLQIRTGTNGGTSGDLVYDIIANEPSSNWKSGTYNYSSFTTINTNKSFHIYYKDNHSVVPSGKSSSTNANTSITFYIKKYYGASALEEPTAAQIKALKSVTSSRTLVEEEFNFGDGKYWYYCIPKETDSGAALKFSIGAKGAESPQSGNYFIYEMNDFTNAQGYTVPLRIYKFKKTPAGLPDKITGSSYVKVD